MIILVTGATGHIGNVLVRELVKQGRQVRALLLPGESQHPLNDLDVEIVEGDVLDPASLVKACKGVDLVFHLAGMISICPGKDRQVWRVNVEGTRNIIHAVIENGCARLVYTSSIHALRRVDGDEVMDEGIAFDPHNSVGVYDRSKAAASLAVLEAVRQGLNAVLVCPTGVVGPFDYRVSEMGNLILSWINSKFHFLINGSFDFVDVRDVARGHILAAEKGKSGETYILSGEQISLIRMNEIVRQTTGKKAMMLPVPIPLAHFAALFTPIYYRMTQKIPQFTRYSIVTVTGNSRYSHAKSSQELGYTPRPLTEAIVDTVTWWMQNKKYVYSTKHLK